MCSGRRLLLPGRSLNIRTFHLLIRLPALRLGVRHVVARSIALVLALVHQVLLGGKLGPRLDSVCLVHIFPGFPPTLDGARSALALLNLDGRPFKDGLGPLDVLQAALARLAAQNGLAAALGFLGNSGFMVGLEDRWPVVDRFGRWFDVLERLVRVDARRGGAPGGSRVP